MKLMRSVLSSKCNNNSVSHQHPHCLTGGGGGGGMSDMWAGHSINRSFAEHCNSSSCKAQCLATL